MGAAGDKQGARESVFRNSSYRVLLAFDFRATAAIRNPTLCER
jgi:hypothetical protein